MTHTFSIKEVFKAGWHDLRAHSGLAFKVVLTLLAIRVAAAIVEKVLDGTALGVMAGIVLAIAGTVAGIGATVITLKLAEHKHAVYADLIPRWGIIWRFVVAGILAGLVVLCPLVVGGLLALAGFFAAGGVISFSDPSAAQVPSGALALAIVLGLAAVAAAVYLGLRYSMVRYAVIDGAKVVDSLRRSWQMTRGAALKLVLFAIVVMLLNLAGALLFLVGLLVTIPISMLAMAHVYLKLKHRHHGA